MRRGLQTTSMTQLALGACLAGAAGLLAACIEPGSELEASRDRAKSLPPFDEALGVYIVGGDLMMTPEELAMYRDAEGSLVVGTWLGFDRTWRADVARQLTYCISDQFEDKPTMLAQMVWATSQWEAADVRFTYKPGLDATCETTQGVVLRIVPMQPSADARVKAMAAYPPVSGVRVTQNIYFNKAGVYTNVVVHEMGHVLGFGHEHDHPEFEAPAAWRQCREDMMSHFSLYGDRAVGPFDPKSVMLYEHCGGEGSSVIKANEVARAQEVYGVATPRTIEATPHYFTNGLTRAKFPAGRYKFVAIPSIATIAYGPGIYVEHSGNGTASIVTFDHEATDPDIFAPAVAKVYRLD